MRLPLANVMSGATVSARSALREYANRYRTTTRKYVTSAPMITSGTIATGKRAKPNTMSTDDSECKHRYRTCDACDFRFQVDVEPSTERQRLQLAVVEAAKVELAAYSAPGSFGWTARLYRVQRELRNATRALLAFEADHAPVERTHL